MKIWLASGSLFLFPSSGLGSHLVGKLLLALEAELPGNCVPKLELGNEEGMELGNEEPPLPLGEGQG